MLVIENLNFKYSRRDREYTLKNISFSAAPGELLAVIGPNGGGKSTLMKCAAGVLVPESGKMTLAGTCLFSASPEDRARAVAYMPQTQSPPACGVFDAVLLGRKPHLRFRAHAKDLMKVESVMRSTGTAHIASKRCDEISGGELQKVALARAIAQEPKALLLDEPTNHLDLKNQAEMMKLIKRLTGELNMITVAVIHDINLALKYADRFLMVKEGKIFADLNISQVTKAVIDSLYSVDSAIYDAGGDKIVSIN